MIVGDPELIVGRRFPVAIMGSGLAGLSIALELDRHGIDSLLLEAGGIKFDAQSQKEYRGRVVGDPLYDLSHARLRQFGGTSGQWNG